MIGRVALGSLVVAILALAPAAQAAGPTRQECIGAADEGQKLRDDGKLTSAREKFITCSAKACPAVVSKQCSQWLEEVDRDIPSVSFRVLDEQKKELLDVKVVIDGKKVSDAVEVKARPMDPGDHVVRIERADGKSVEQKILLRASEKNRIVELVFEPPPAPVTPVKPEPSPAPAVKVGSDGFHVPLLGWVGLGVGVLGGVGTYLFASAAKSETDDLRTSCSPNCPSSKRDPIDQKLLFANVSLGVGIVGLGVGVVATVLANTGKKKEPAPSAASLSVDMGPGNLLVRGTF